MYQIGYTSYLNLNLIKTIEKMLSLKCLRNESWNGLKLILTS